MQKKCKKLRDLLLSRDTEYIMEAHSGVSARIVEEAGFKGIWASSLSISAAMGVRDCNEASWTQVLETVEFMSDNTSVPILLDADTGYGNFNNIRRLIRKLEQRGIAGLCIEDKVFPKTNSFIGGEKQPLADMDEFCGKISAAKNARKDMDFVIIARLEAFITGWGLEEALKRARAYRDAGADALFVHSKIETADQIRDFMAGWDGPCPVVIAPTTYYKTDPKLFRDLGVSLVIWGNHMLRSSITAMQRSAKELYASKSPLFLEDEIVPVAEIFRLQDTDELREAERKYLPKKESAKAVILAASHGPEFEELTRDRPKAMIEVDGRPILESLVYTLNDCGIKDITAVLGYRPEVVNITNLKKIIHKEWAGTGNAYTLYQALNELSGPVVISFGDIMFESCVLKNILDTSEDIVLSVDTSWSNSIDREHIRHVRGAEPHSELFGTTTCAHLKDIGYDMPGENSNGEWIGLIKLSTRGTDIFKSRLTGLMERKENHNRSLVDFIKYLLGEGVNISLNYFRGRWLDVDNKDDIKRYVCAKEGVK